MKRLLFLLLTMSLPIQTNHWLESTDERISYECVHCEEPLSRSEVSLALLTAIHQEPPTFICDKCRNKLEKVED